MTNYDHSSANDPESFGCHGRLILIRDHSHWSKSHISSGRLQISSGKYGCGCDLGTPRQRRLSHQQFVTRLYKHTSCKTLRLELSTQCHRLLHADEQAVLLSSDQFTTTRSAAVLHHCWRSCCVRRSIRDRLCCSSVCWSCGWSCASSLTCQSAPGYQRSRQAC